MPESLRRLIFEQRSLWWCTFGTNGRGEAVETLDEDAQLPETESRTPDALLVREADLASLRHAIEELPTEFRQILVVHELEGLSYKEIAGVAEVPLTGKSRYSSLNNLL